MRHVGIFAIVTAIGCSSSTPGVLRVDQNIPAGFDATYTLSDQWARVQVGYKASKDNIYPEYTITTSLGTTLLHDGVLLQQAPAPIDPRATGGWVVVTPSDPEYALAQGLFNKLMELGVAPRPSTDELATPLYGAAFMAARVIGLDDMRIAYGMTPDDFQQLALHNEGYPVFPYPNHAGLAGDKLTSLLAQISAIQGQDFVVPGLGQCCGSCNNCWRCDQLDHGACDDWCAAGDHCNQFHSGCGTIATWPGHCPHQDSPAINAYGNPVNYCNHHDEHE
jgi:hypothetical protein